MMMKNLTVMIKPASSLCDIRCAYCFYSDVAASRHEASLGLMTREVAAAMIKNIFLGLTAGDHITFAFQGGEPSLAGLDFFNFFTETVKSVKGTTPIRVHYAFQTNGLMVDEAWCHFFRENKVLVGLSLDGDAALHNRNRMDIQGKGTYNRVIDAKKLFDRHGVDYNILCVLTSESARRAQRIWDFILRENIGYIQFIPCLEPLEGPIPSTALTGKRFYQFYSQLFHFWKKEAEKGNIISVRLFEDLAALHLAGQHVTCGLSGRCTPQIIVEGDGSVYPCDFYVLDPYRVGDLTKDNLQEVFGSIVKSDFLNEPRPMPNWCRGCPHNDWCRGGCKRMAKTIYGEHCGMRLFLDECLNDLLATAHKIVRQRQH